MKVFRADTANELFETIAIELRDHPDYTPKPSNVRGGTLHEITNAVVILDNPRASIVTCPERNLSRKYLAGEMLFYLSGSDDLEQAAYYSKFWRKVSDDGRTVNSCYGKRLFEEEQGKSQLTSFNYAYRMLAKSKYSKNATMLITKDRDVDVSSKDHPCTIFLQYLIRPNEEGKDALNLICHMRSNDLWFGWSYDLPFFSFLIDLMRVKLGTEYPDLVNGSYFHYASSLHMYDRDFSKLGKTFKKSKLSLVEEFPEFGFEDIFALGWLIEEEKKYRADSEYVIPKTSSAWVNTLSGWLNEDRL